METRHVFLCLLSLILLSCQVDANSVAVTIATDSATSCPSGSWTRWYHRYHPSGLCDCQTVKKIREENPGEVCENPTKVEAREMESHRAISIYNDSQVDAEIGVETLCSHSRGGATCRDYDVRFCCAPDCLSGASDLYSGTRSVTKDGIPCLYWDSILHPYSGKPLDSTHNHCRDPKYANEGVWCYSSRTFDKAWCGIPKCPKADQVIWSSNDPESLKMYFHMRSTNYGNWPLYGAAENSFVIHSNLAQSPRVGALAVDQKRKGLAFAGHKQNYFGFIKMNWNSLYRAMSFYKYSDSGRVSSIRHPENINANNIQETSNIDAIAYDSVSEKQYWVREGSVKVVTKMKNYVTIHDEAPNEIRAMALDSEASRLYIATMANTKDGTKPNKNNTKLMVMDTTGNNRTVLFSYPEVNNVYGMTIDFTSHRLFWTEILPGDISRVMSANLNGINVKEIFRSSPAKARFQKLAVHGNTIYVTDAMMQQKSFRKKSHVIWVLVLFTSSSWKVKQHHLYPTNEMARDIVVYKGDGQTATDNWDHSNTNSHNNFLDNNYFNNYNNYNNNNKKNNYNNYIEDSNNYNSYSTTSGVTGGTVGGIIFAVIVLISATTATIMRCRRKYRDSQLRQADMEVLII